MDLTRRDYVGGPSTRTYVPVLGEPPFTRSASRKDVFRVKSLTRLFSLSVERRALIGLSVYSSRDIRHSPVVKLSRRGGDSREGSAILHECLCPDSLRTYRAHTRLASARRDHTWFIDLHNSASVQSSQALRAIAFRTLNDACGRSDTSVYGDIYEGFGFVLGPRRPVWVALAG
jgi:hypothetical protein